MLLSSKAQTERLEKRFKELLGETEMHVGNELCRGGKLFKEKVCVGGFFCLGLFPSLRA